MSDEQLAQQRFAEAVARCEANLDEVEVVRGYAPCASEPPGELDVRWALVVLRADLERCARQAGAAGGSDDDSLRERYGALVDAARAYPELAERVRLLGRRLRELEDEGLLPQTMVARSPRPPA